MHSWTITSFYTNTSVDPFMSDPSAQLPFIFPSLTCCQLFLLGFSKVTLVSLAALRDDSIEAHIRGPQGAQCPADITTLHGLINGKDS